ncbi:acetolactate synthase large subunit [Microbulbifer sp. TYP-18]|uniref:acetolactate synthase large subunit n=1 Tax=Microbulbifer sp. TYP-18 TaxID=3230024 RepID=UPI0034C60A9C
MPNGAQALIKTLVDAGIEVCFSNPGTSEMHFVAALDGEPKLRAILALFEGVATGAADGYARMADKPAATLLHLGCGLGNGLANLHNARKGNSPVVNIVGDHATYHVKYDAQLQSDIETVARNVSPNFVRTSESTESLCRDAADAVTAARGLPGQVATLVLPADVSWGDGGQPCAAPPQPQAPTADNKVIDSVADAIRNGRKTAMLLGGRALREPGLLAAARIAAHTGVTVFAETFPARIQRGAGLPPVERIAYLAELVSLQLSEFDNLILVDAKAPVSFFAYPGKQSYLVPDSCTAHTLSTPEQDATANLNKLAEVLGASQAQPMLQPAGRPGRPKGKLTAEKVCRAVGELMPENSIIVDESITSGLLLNAMTAGAPRHDMITLTGGAIGQGLPSAIGAAVACPDRPVLALIGDGTAMYTNQALWTMARENLDVTTIIFNNASYSILNVELERVGAKEAGEKAKSQLDISGPVTNYALLAQSMGVHGTRVKTSEALLKAMEYALNNPGPHLIEAVIPESLNGMKRKVLPRLLKILPNLPRVLSKALKKKIAP